ncbi:MAG: PrsW family glutamic-type intramembrane protease [Caldilineales bacterium]|nr:PrsW family glutamic-type intramembrane protease [Caldilineales bacterium]
MSQTICCVCEKPIAGEVLRLGGRPYCAPCYARVTADRRGMWWASLVGAGVLVLFVLVVALVAGLARPHLEGGALLTVSLILALVPAAIWLAIFYVQDVREPEPKPLVLGVFLLGALLAQAVGRPVNEGLFAVSRWMATAGPLSHILAAILIVGFTEMFLVYAAVRFSVYGLPEFDERVDGVIYGTAAALGYATVLNVAFVVESGGVDLVAGTVRIAVTALALASFGGLLGYFLGRCKFEDEPLWWMPAGLALAAALNGLFIYLRGEVTTTAVGLQGGGYNPWPGLILAAVVAGVTFGVLFYLLSRLRRRLAAVSP